METNKNKCIQALECFADDDKMDELAQKFSPDKDYTSIANYETARKWCYDQLKQCVDKTFGNSSKKPKVHDKKLIDSYFEDVWNGLKTFELRKNDCDYQVGDYMVLREFLPTLKAYSGKVIMSRITYKLQGYTGLQDGYCILGIQIIEKHNPFKKEIKDDEN